MAVQNGTALLVKIGGTLLSCQTEDSSLNFTRDMIETTCKDSTDAAKTYIAGEKDTTIDVTAAYDMAATNGFSEVFADFDAGTLVDWTWGSTVIGQKSYTGSAYISDLSIGSPQNDKSTYAFTLQVSGVVTEQVNA